MSFDELKRKLKSAKSKSEIENLLRDAVRPQSFFEVLGEISGANSQDDLRMCEKNFDAFFVPEGSSGKFRSFADQMSSILFEWSLSRMLLDSGWSRSKLREKREHVLPLMEKWWQHIAKSFYVAQSVEEAFGDMSCTQSRFWLEWNRQSEDPSAFKKLLDSISDTEAELYFKLLV